VQITITDRQQLRTVTGYVTISLTRECVCNIQPNLRLELARRVHRRPVFKLTATQVAALDKASDQLPIYSESCLNS
jgi:hypothetical protein